jgi:uncharacterized protein (TIGR01777 family)
MKVVLTGASGLLGRALVSSLRGDEHQVVRLVRRAPAAPDEAQWDPRGGGHTASGADTALSGALSGADAVIHLAGPGMGDRPWTPARKRLLLEDRVSATRTIAAAMAAADPRPRVLLSMSGIGIYGNPGEQVVTEDHPLGTGYVAQIAAAWEGATSVAADAGIRVVRLRTGVVLSASGGAFGRLLPIFRLGLGGRLGTGRQWWSWVALPDYVAAVRFLLEHEEIAGPVNITAPEPIRNADLTKAMGRVLHRPTVTFVPSFALKLPLRDFAEDLLGGQRAVPQRLIDARFSFAHPRFEPALRAVLTQQAHDATTS